LPLAEDVSACPAERLAVAIPSHPRSDVAKQNCAPEAVIQLASDV
jgi:hypothetical protein